MTVRPPAATAVAEANLQQQVLDFLDGSSFGPAGGGKRIDTHASMVFLGADRALKIKRAVRLPFLDYSTLEKRKRACEEELKVNAGNAPELYRRVVAVTRNSDGAFEIDGTGTPVEWAVEMTRFDEQQSLDRVAASKPVDPSLATAVADAILQSHDRAPRADGESWLASLLPIIERNTAKFRTVRGLDAVAVNRLDAAGRNSATTLQPLLRQRAGQGFVRRCHGDLHLANIALVDGRPLLFDAIEFDPVIATTDVLYDLAFTLMDLVHFNQDAAAGTVFNRYLAGAGDEGLDGLRLLPLFLSVRAAIRAHVLFMKSEQAGGNDEVWREAKRYFDLAGRLIAPKPPLLVAIGGLSGTGKSVLARGLAGLIEPPPGAVIIRSDVVRKQLFGASETTALPESAYRPDIATRVYGELAGTAQRVLAQGCSVVLDAAYLQEAERTEIAGLAAMHGVRFVGLFLTADLATRLARIEQRRGDASDATRDVALKQETFAIGAVDWHMIDASGTPEQSLRSACASLLARAEGVS
ncbi:bifunctional aminoglycoside phosphotransferase/ATP-binding protein [Bradyrhizobium sp. AUGA SZCCT0283]|uniref:bifunctional aminoglycoside phosphotransferase/ATP-binding protein n=1 Tax=Bradyrhizobium sp. AUGA SZCCT0283 TaxID=2807671 RepID=UPI001BA6A34F|nr:bifunctional aminoglycoside phosphotransferase/ATP-binding protein [Bradyrhizobium sp. AUGA SZCCT0283]MBR1277823.1 AAA family ATPase [Bradyrhizobium sp. AUGA SZCCT0283]